MRRILFIATVLCALAAFASQPRDATAQSEPTEDTARDLVAQTDEDEGDDGAGAWGRRPSSSEEEEEEPEAGPDAPPDEPPAQETPSEDGDATPGTGTAPARLERDGDEAREARKAAMQALSQKHPGRGDGQGLGPVVPTPPPIVREVPEVLPRVEHHGYLRGRLDLFYNMDLDTRGTSPIAPPLDSDQRDETRDFVEPTDAETLAGGNMRFRYAPTLHITEDLRINATLDFLDNYVLGTTPDGIRGSRTDLPLIGLTHSTETPTFGNIGRDAIDVRALYGEADTLLGTIRFGRLPVHWGLGILNNAGTHSRLRQLLGEDAWSCIDCDFGDYQDRVEIETRIPFIDWFYITFSWDFVWEGLAGYNYASTFGQAMDLAQADDVLQFTISIFDRPNDRQSAELWRRDFNEFRPVFAWGAYFVYRQQDADLSRRPNPADFVGPGSGNNNGLDLVFRGLTLYTPDLWGKLAWKFNANMHMKLEAELVSQFGTIEQVDVDDTVERDILQFGGAIESEFRFWDAYAGLNAGFATGKETPGFGYRDVSDLGNASLLEVTRKINNYRFDRNYTVDLIMFRELIGGVTNAVYFDVWGKYEFPTGPADSPNILGARLDLITSAAIEKEATPGNETFLGFETDLSLYYKETDRFMVELEGGVLIPGAAWTRRAGRNYPLLPDPSIYADHLTIDKDISAAVPWTIQANIWWLF